MSAAPYDDIDLWASWEGSLRRITSQDIETLAREMFRAFPSTEKTTVWVSLVSPAEARRAYVPEDVARWRDPEHRAELVRRAREMAAARRRAGGER